MRWFACLFSLVLALLLLWGVDAFCGSKTPAVGVVVGRTYTPETIIYTQQPKGPLVPQIVPAAYYLEVNGPHGPVSLQVDPYAYLAAEGSRFRYTESRGLFTHHLYSF